MLGLEAALDCQHALPPAYPCGVEFTSLPRPVSLWHSASLSSLLVSTGGGPCTGLLVTLSTPNTWQTAGVQQG